MRHRYSVAIYRGRVRGNDYAECFSLTKKMTPGDHDSQESFIISKPNSNLDV